MSRKPSTDPVIADASKRALGFASALSRPTAAKSASEQASLIADHSTAFTWLDHGRVVVRWNPTLAEALLDTPMGKLPVEMLRRLPFPAMFFDLSALGIERPDNRYDGVTVRWIGFFVTERDRLLDKAHERFNVAIETKFDADALVVTWVGEDRVEDRPELDAVTLSFMRMAVGRSNPKITFDEALLAHVEQCVKHEYEASVLTTRQAQRLDNDAYLSRLIDTEAVLMKTVLALCLYLASDEPDVAERLAPDTKRERWRTNDDRKRDAKIIDAGWTIGPMLAEAAKRRHAEGEGDGSTRAPHMRRAHWHLFWTGPGRTVPRVNWVAATPVLGGGEGKVLV